MDQRNACPPPAQPPGAPHDLDREQRAVAAAELQHLADELEAEAREAQLRAAACRAGARALLAVEK